MEESQLHYAQAIRAMAKSPLGCIFGSSLLLCKEVNYPLMRNCHDIVELLGEGKEGLGEGEAKKDAMRAALFVIEALSQSGLAPK